MDVGDQGRPLLLRGGEARRLAQAIAREHLRRGNLEQPALLQRREFPGIGDREEALQGAACWCAAPRGGWPAAAPIAVRFEICLARLRSLKPLSILPNARRSRYHGACRMKFRRTARPSAASPADSLVCVGLDPDLGQAAGGLARRPAAASRLQPAHRRCDRAIIAAAYKPQIAFYSALGQGGRARREHPLHPRARARRAGHPRRQAQRHRQHRRGLRARGLRSLRRRRGHGQSLHGRGLGAARFSPGPIAARSCCAAPRIPAPGIFRIC